MKNRWIMVSASVAALALTACGGGADEANQAAAEGATVENVVEPAENQAIPAGQTATSGQQYAELAGGSDLYEIESARLALEKAQRSEVRELAQMILTDHQRSTTELTAAAGQAQPAIQVAPAMTPDQQANVAALRAATGEAFDQEYLRQQVAAHEQALALVTDYAQNGDVPSLRQHASTVRGPISQHLDRARNLSQGGNP